MAVRALRRRGFSLVELMVGLCVASIVAVLATTSLTAAGIALQRHLVASRTEDRAWSALAAIVRDLKRASVWQMCTEARDCPKKKIAREYAMPALVAGDVGWLVADELRRCDKDCQTYVDGVMSLEVVADIAVTDRLTARQPLLQRHAGRARALEITLTMRDGRRFSRVVSRPEPTP
jgi:prepilin-type N-terminal cleavage/methylation domain-containing protein